MMSSEMSRKLHGDLISGVYGHVDKRVYRGLSARIKRRVENRNFSEAARWLVNLQVILNGMEDE